MSIGCAFVLVLHSSVTWWRFATHRACVAGCDSEHGRAIAGNQGILYASACWLAAALSEVAL